jgi:hypothetical protein
LTDYKKKYCIHGAFQHVNVTAFGLCPLNGVQYLIILSKFFYSPTDAQVNFLKNNFKIHVKIDIKTAPTCFGAVTPSSGSALLVIPKVTVVKITN